MTKLLLSFTLLITALAVQAQKNRLALTGSFLYATSTEAVFTQANEGLTLESNKTGNQMIDLTWFRQLPTKNIAWFVSGGMGVSKQVPEFTFPVTSWNTLGFNFSLNSKTSSITHRFYVINGGLSKTWKLSSIFSLASDLGAGIVYGQSTSNGFDMILPVADNVSMINAGKKSGFVTLNAKNEIAPLFRGGAHILFTPVSKLSFSLGVSALLSFQEYAEVNFRIQSPQTEELWGEGYAKTQFNYIGFQAGIHYHF